MIAEQYELSKIVKKNQKYVYIAYISVERILRELGILSLDKDSV